MHQQSSDWLWWGEPEWVRAPGDWDQPAASTPLVDLQAFAKATAAQSSPLGAESVEQILVAIEGAALRILEQRNRREGLPSQWVRGRFWAWLVGKR